jgi:hypothetical protein
MTIWACGLWASAPLWWIAANHAARPRVTRSAKTATNIRRCRASSSRGNGGGDLVDHAGILAVLPLLPVQPSAGGVALARHPSGQQVGAGLGAGDVAQMRARRPGRVGGLADAA